MKNHIWAILFFAVLAAIAVICFTFPVVSKYEPSNQPKPEIVYTPDTLCVQQLEALQKENAILQDSILRLNSTIPIDCYMCCRRVEKINYYIKITEKNKDNEKFFLGWIRRTMSD